MAVSPCERKHRLGLANHEPEGFGPGAKSDCLDLHVFTGQVVSCGASCRLSRQYLSLDSGSRLMLGGTQIVCCLQVKPEFRRVAEVPGEP